ncbi:MAG: substrate-binding domain-containing protein [Rubripirellula sp.]|nr:substrate-binding domain-containing protein [Rubripirellula sp.]
MNRKLSHFVAFALLALPVTSSVTSAQEKSEQASVEEIRSILDSIRPYLPAGDVKTEIDIFGSTSMDTLAHGWAAGFNNFHPESEVVISAEGSERVFDRIAKNPSSIAMLSRPVTEADIELLKKKGMKQPVAVMVAREAIGIFVHRDNPLDSIDYTSLQGLFCSNGQATQATWAAAGLSGNYEDKPVVTVGRGKDSGTHTYLQNYLFRGQAMNDSVQRADSNYQVVSKVAADPFAIAISGLRCGGHEAKLLNLKSNGSVIPTDDRSLLLGKYPLMRPLCLVLDMGATSEVVRGNREFVLYALSQAGQTQAILAGFFPFDPPTLLGQVERLNFDRKESPAPVDSSNPALKSTARESQEKVSR